MIDVLHEAGLAIVRRWRRNLLSLCAVAVGAASTVAVLGFSEAGAQRVADRLGASDAMTIAVTGPRRAWNEPESAVERRALALGRVAAAGTLTLPTAGGGGEAELESLRSDRAARGGVAVASRAGLTARGVAVVDGTVPSEAAIRLDPRQILLGAALARELGVDAGAGSNALRLNGTRVTVAGIVRDGGVNAALATAVVLSERSARVLELLPDRWTVLVRTAAPPPDRLADAVRVAVFPLDAEDVSVVEPPSAKRLRAEVVADNRALVTVVSAVMAVSTALAVTMTMQIGVWERRSQIGVDRALGMTRAAVARRFVVESGLLGLAGATIGWSLGVVVLAGVVRLLDWPFVLSPTALVVVPAAAVVALTAGVLPAVSATRVHPAELLRD